MDFSTCRWRADVDIVLIDATNPFGAGRLLPAGRLREPKAALGRADIVVITRSNHAPALEAVIRRHSGAPIFYARPGLDSLYIFRSAESREESAAGRDRQYFVFCGIGNPSAFLIDLREWGFQITGHIFFPDHHRYTPGDARAIESAARKAGAHALICTEKDIFNLAGAGMLTFDVFYCRISMRIDLEEEFWRTITTVAESALFVAAYGDPITLHPRVVTHFHSGEGRRIPVARRSPVLDFDCFFPDRRAIYF